MELPVTVPLKRPITVGDTTYSELVFDEPDLAAQIAYAELEASFANPPSKVDAARVLHFWISHLADVPAEVASKVKGRDVPAIEVVLDGIMKLGKASSDGDDAVGNESPAT